MRARSVLLFAVALLCGLFATNGDAFAAKRVALVIGNSAYQNVAALPNPANDAASVADMFKNAGFDTVDLRRDVGSLDMRRALRDFYDKAASADIAVVYYAGHGIEVDGTNYMVPVDAVLKRDRDVDDEAVSLDRILESVEQAKQLRLIILDACRDNPFARTMIRTTAARALTTRGLIAAEPTTSNTLIAYAAKGGSTADDGSSGHSPFTTALLAHLTTPGLDVRQAFGEVRDDVLKATDNKQEPYVYGSLGGGQMTLVSAPATPPAAAAATPATPVAAPAATDTNLQMRQDYEFAERVGTKQAWTYFLQHYPDGLYANLAKAQLDKLSTAAAAPTTPTAAAAPAQPQPKTQVAALPTDASRTAINPADLARSVQTELKRVGCYSGAVDGDWNTGSRRALDQFNKYAPAKLDTKLASSDALEALHAKTTRVCPLVCDHGFQAGGDSCTRIVCKDGYQVGDDNTCEKIPAKRSTPTAGRQQQQQSQPAPTRQSSRAGGAGGGAAGGGAEILCNDHGCMPKPKGCTVVAVPTGQGCQY